jgi:hypothetical protein
MKKKSIFDKNYLLKEIAQIKRAFKLAEQIKSGKIKGRPAGEILNKL